MKAVLEAVMIPVHVMARPHDRGFTYRGAERLALLRDVSRVAKLKPTSTFRCCARFSTRPKVYRWHFIARSTNWRTQMRASTF